MYWLPVTVLLPSSNQLYDDEVQLIAEQLNESPSLACIRLPLATALFLVTSIMVKIDGQAVGVVGVTEVGEVGKVGVGGGVV
jgi:hypothetical protein